MTYKKFNSALTPEQQAIYVELSRFAREVYEGDATRFDLVGYAVGYYGAVSRDTFIVINRLWKEGVVNV